MAENRNRQKDINIIDDDFIRITYKAGLAQLKASDELIKNTLDKCRAELETTAEKRMPIKVTFSRIALRYAAPVAACLLVVFLLLYSPLLNRPKHTTDSALPPAQAGAGLSKDAGASAAQQTPSVTVKFDEVVKPSQYLRMEQSECADSDVNVEEPAPDGEGGLGIMYYSLTAGEAKLRSIDFGGIHTTAMGDMPSGAVNAILGAYNSEMGTRYTSDESRIMTVAILKAGGIGPEALRGASGFGALLSGQRYYLLPLKDENQEYAILLPVAETIEILDDSASFDIVFSQEGRTWLTSKDLAIYTDNGFASYLLDMEEHLRLVQDTFKVKQVTDYMAVDINGYDFIIIVKADGKEFAVPCFNTGSMGSIENSRAYTARDVLDGLADSLEAR